MNVISAFSGIGTTFEILNQLDIKVTNGYSFEIEKAPIKVEHHHFPNVKQLGDINKWDEHDFPTIDLLVAGFPCNSFSMAGKQLGFDDPRGQLFFTLMDMFKTLKPKYFFFENVFMKPEHENKISEMVGVEPIKINSGKFKAAAWRRRNYWTNITGVSIDDITDHNITFGSIRDTCPQRSSFYTPKGIEWMLKAASRHKKNQGKNKYLRMISPSKTITAITASHAKNYSAERFFYVPEYERLPRVDDPRYQLLFPNAQDITDATYDSKRQCIISVKHGIDLTRPGDLLLFPRLRYITTLEAERAMNLPHDYTAMLVKSPRFKVIGNGFEVMAVKHLMKGLKDGVSR
jgi:DNA-cytosine methyltransferase